MKTIYQVTQNSPISNRIVSELNAAVLTATFPTKTGVHNADLYSCKNSSDVLVYKSSCAPVNSTFVQSVQISF